MCCSMSEKSSDVTATSLPIHKTRYMRQSDRHVSAREVCVSWLGNYDSPKQSEKDRLEAR